MHIPHINKQFLHDLRIMKVIVMVGLLAVTFLPPQHATLVNMATNMLWLWRT